MSLSTQDTDDIVARKVESNKIANKLIGMAIKTGMRSLTSHMMPSFSAWKRNERRTTPTEVTFRLTDLPWDVQERIVELSTQREEFVNVRRLRFHQRPLFRRSRSLGRSDQVIHISPLNLASTCRDYWRLSNSYYANNVWCSWERLHHCERNEFKRVIGEEKFLLMERWALCCGRSAREISVKYMPNLKRLYIELDYDLLPQTVMPYLANIMQHTQKVIQGSSIHGFKGIEIVWVSTGILGQYPPRNWDDLTIWRHKLWVDWELVGCSVWHRRLQAIQGSLCRWNDALPCKCRGPGLCIKLPNFSRKAVQEAVVAIESLGFGGPIGSIMASVREFNSLCNLVRETSEPVDPCKPNPCDNPNHTAEHRRWRAAVRENRTRQKKFAELAGEVWTFYRWSLSLISKAELGIWEVGVANKMLCEPIVQHSDWEVGMRPWDHYRDPNVLMARLAQVGGLNEEGLIEEDANEDAKDDATEKDVSQEGIKDEVVEEEGTVS